jgi:hypothetical protein
MISKKWHACICIAFIYIRFFTYFGIQCGRKAILKNVNNFINLFFSLYVHNYIEISKIDNIQLQVHVNVLSITQIKKSIIWCQILTAGYLHIYILCQITKSITHLLNFSYRMSWLSQNTVFIMTWFGI